MNDFQNTIKTLIQGSPSGDFRLSSHALFTGLKPYYDQLGDCQSALVQYISEMIGATNVTMLYEAAETGFETANRLHQICKLLADENGIDPKHHEYYDAIRNKREAYSRFSDNRTILDLYYLELFDFHAEVSMNRYHMEQETKMLEFASLPTLSRFHSALEKKLGNAAQDISSMLIEYFVCVRVMDAFRQGMLNEYHYSLSNVDAETGKPIFQLWMETL